MTIPQNMIRRTRSKLRTKARRCIYLADGMGACWLGGWRDRATAEARLAQCEATDWDTDQVDSVPAAPYAAGLRKSIAALEAKAGRS